MLPLLLLSPCYGRHYHRSICTASPIHLISQLLLLYVTSILEKDRVVKMPYGDGTLDSEVRDEHGEEGWDAEGYDTWRRVRTV